MILYSFFRSSAAWRVRIALHLKGLDCRIEARNFRSGAQRSPDYLAVNPQGLVPALSAGEATLTQSLAIVEYLEEIYPSPPLLPREAIARAQVRAMAALERGSLTLTPQPDEGVVYASKIDKAECRIDWSRPASQVHNHIRGLSPFPGAWCEMEIGGKRERGKILRRRMAAGGDLLGRVGQALLHLQEVRPRSGVHGGCGNQAGTHRAISRSLHGRQERAEEFVDHGNQLRRGAVALLELQLDGVFLVEIDPGRVGQGL